MGFASIYYNDMNIKHRIQKFWSGYSSVEDRQQLLSQLERQDPELKETLKTLFDKQIDAPCRTLTDTQKKRAYANILASISVPTSRPNPVLWRTALTVAATLLLITGVCWSIWRYGAYSDAPSPQMTNTPASIVNASNLDKTYRLPDSSKVTLSPGSSLSYMPHFSDTARILTLLGRGKFDVKKDKKRPFTVISNSIATTALGTIFIVDGDHRKTDIHLLEGSILIESTTPATSLLKKTRLQPGDYIAIDNTTQQLEWKVAVPRDRPLNKVKDEPKMPSVHTVKIATPTLRFESTALKAVFEQIAQSKRVTINHEDVDLRKLTFTGEFNESDTLEHVLDIICGLNELEYQKSGSTYYLHQKQETIK